jgi:hypothetical protein
LRIADALCRDSILQLMQASAKLRIQTGHPVVVRPMSF